MAIIVDYPPNNGSTPHRYRGGGGGGNYTLIHVAIYLHIEYVALDSFYASGLLTLPFVCPNGFFVHSFIIALLRAS